MTHCAADIEEEVAQLAKQIRSRTKAVLRLAIDTDINGDSILTLISIIVPEKKRGKGVGSAALTMLTDAADARGWTIELEADDCWGTPLPVLRAWYHSHGFRGICSSARTYMQRAPVQPRTDPDIAESGGLLR